MTDASPANMVRGPLKYVVETSSPQIEAGKKFSLSVRITNPYDVPVIIRQVVTKVPAKFVSFDAKRNTFREGGEIILKAIIAQRSLRPLLDSPGGETIAADSNAS